MNQDQLRAKSLALFHALVSNWANDLRKEVTGLQDDLIQRLDKLQERMSTYEEKIDEERILAFANEAMSLARGGGAGGETLKKVRAAQLKIDRGTSLTEVLTILLEELSQFAPRVALFILKGGACIGWNGRGFDTTPGFSNEAIKKISVPTSADTLFSTVINSRSGFVGDSNRQRDNVQLLSRIGNVLPSTVFATPLILRERIAAVVYADSGDGAQKLQDSDALEILTAYASKLLDALSGAKVRTGEHTPPSVAPPPAASAAPPRESVMSRVPAPSRALASQEDEEGSGTVMFSSTEMMSGMGSAAAARPQPRRPPAAGPDFDSLDPETRKRHEEAQRFARLLVSEIKLYNESKVQQGRSSRDLYDLLRDDIERSRQLYRERVAESIRVGTNYFNDELVRILADGDEGAMGQPLPAT